MDEVYVSTGFYGLPYLVGVFWGTPILDNHYIDLDLGQGGADFGHHPLLQRAPELDSGSITHLEAVFFFLDYGT